MTNMTVLAGFLGAGKTTLMQRLINSLDQRGIRYAVVSNDFGSINVDAALIKTDEPIIEITDGSMFCSCKEHTFVEGLLALKEHNPQEILVEASGLSDPSSMKTLASTVQKDWPELKIRGTVSVVDVSEITELAELMPVVENQVQAADLIIANKSDLVDEETLTSVTEWLAEQNSTATIVTTDHCSIEPEKLYEILAGPHAEAGNAESYDTAGTKPLSLFIAPHHEVSLKSLVEFIEAIANKAYRIKGTVMTDEGLQEVSTTRSNQSICATEVEPRRRGLVLIAADDKNFTLDVVNRWERIVSSPMTLT